MCNKEPLANKAKQPTSTVPSICTTLNYRYGRYNRLALVKSDFQTDICYNSVIKIIAILVTVLYIIIFRENYQFNSKFKIFLNITYRFSFKFISKANTVIRH